MSCASVHVDRLIEASRRCEACADPAPWRCAWPVMKPAKITVGDLRVGDRIWWTRLRDTLSPDEVAPVVIASLTRTGMFPLWNTSELIRVEYGYRKSDPLAATLADDYEVFALRPGICEALCCDRHAREVGEEKHYCQAHWRSWEQVP